MRRTGTNIAMCIPMAIVAGVLLLEAARLFKELWLWMAGLIIVLYSLGLIGQLGLRAGFTVAMLSATVGLLALSVATLLTEPEACYLESRVGTGSFLILLGAAMMIRLIWLPSRSKPDAAMRSIEEDDSG